MSPPPPLPHALGPAETSTEPLINPLAFDQQLASSPDVAAAFLRLLDGERYIAQAQAHAALAGVPLARVLTSGASCWS
jgi:hypothetical protein